MTDQITDYKNTLNLADTTFAMRGDLAKREPLWLEQWEKDDVYGQIRQARQGRKTYILHDGPPYANGQIHLGHVVNKVLKDIIIKYKTLDGYDAPYVPGWDCHGLPIEQKVEQKIGKVGQKVNATKFREACREYAKSQVQLQMADFKRLGVLGDWDNPYLTMNYQQEANIVRALGKIYDNGHIVRGMKPVNWCLDCGSALAEAEVEYQDKTSDAIYVGFDIVNRENLPIIANISGTLQAVIWTTTPWTLPANQAISVHGDFDYVVIKGKKTPIFALPSQIDSKNFTLRTLTKADKQALQACASDPAIWQFMPTKRHLPEVFEPFFEQAVKDKAYAIIDKRTGNIIGTTRFCHDNAKDDTIGIGFTFITPEFWGKGVNDEIKHTLLNHAFKYRNAVCFQIHEGNDRSKKAVEKLGAVYQKDVENDFGKMWVYTITNPSTINHTTHFIVANDLVADFSKNVALDDVETITTIKGADLTVLNAQHPLISERQVPIITGEHVTADSGTGLVHTAPAHGVDDYIVGNKYNLPVENPVSDAGVYLDNAKVFVGEHIYKAQPKIIETLGSSGHLLDHKKIRHSYPHCWRHKTPIIFRATPQWFISMEQNGLRQKALNDIKNITWTPAWGQNRIEAMIDGRPDWCISRQRTWGVPITFFIHKETDQLHPRTSELIEKAAQIIEKGGIEAWFDADISDFLGDESGEYHKVTDTLDVWFDSGATNFAVLNHRKELSNPADLYLEGSDQHRGWFQSSLLVSESIYGRPPYKQVLTHGFTVDAKGHKLSKSKGNTKGFEPSDIANKMGVDILRLWVGSSDYRYEMAVSKEGFDRTTDMYRRIRNTIRFLLANTDDFDPKTDMVSTDKLISLDKYILYRTKHIQQEIIQAYHSMDFHQVCQTVMGFCSQDLGGFYLDIIKDRTYTTKADGLPRRSAQTTLYHIAHALLRWIAPVLSFTAQEAWQVLKDTQGYIFTAEWYQLPDFQMNDISHEDWDKVALIKDTVNKSIEQARSDKIVSSNLTAKVTITAPQDIADILNKFGDELRFVFITSDATVKSGDTLSTTITPADGTKCVRCWHVRTDVGTHAEHPEICGRCVQNLDDGEMRLYA
ncbi:isoleucine--tRNA ligase, N-acetyltransferase domain-containing [Moraxella catarrhalis]|uniref:isoleucine--tRNA ligase, N-acetyltransferase domain-containing n=2 Tax=Moraxella catarrhalis TaxID=480 RepID=UPI000202AA00|nr:isoleucine--tRNA ligase, N-acetyltransferase domain-containing [Moraxella catarrhalis]EGE19929.1 isoleucyl-tRNA synthetase [Moraxella catarrhalis BC8]MPW54922.1 isoleucine--tRNA ligase [Moraxella catarrhalis]MPX01467.1 isoleucine--tRNA ligase [Moraxella catarrhalis]MPX41434.1 isoleucine--tRNA ligase [Moraxella catarrhalis]OBX42525.1 isoleucine--tRNA ligase [Moraxella catarrhalis]